MSEHELWNELGNLYYLSGSYEQAIHAYNKAIQLDTRYGKPYSNLALIYAKQARYEIAIDLYKRSLELLKNDEEKATTWNRLGNVYRHLKEYDEAVNAYHYADDLRAAATRYDGHADQMLYVSSESETPPLELVETQREYQNHSVDYMRDVEPEFDETIPDWVPVDAEMLVNEVDYGHKTKAVWKVGSSSGFTPPPMVADEKQAAFVVSENESITLVPDSVEVDEDAQPAVAAEAPIIAAEQVTTDETSVDELVQPLIEDGLVDVAPATESNEIVSDELHFTTVDTVMPLEDELVDADLVAIEPISQPHDVADTLPAEVEALEADTKSADEALETDPVSQDPVTQVEHVTDTSSADVVEDTEADVRSADEALETDPVSQETITQVEDVTGMSSAEVEGAEADVWSADEALETDPVSQEPITQVDDVTDTPSDEAEALDAEAKSADETLEAELVLPEPIAQADDVKVVPSDEIETSELKVDIRSGEDAPETDLSSFEPIAQAEGEVIKGEQDFDPVSSTSSVEGIYAKNEDAQIVKREIDEEEEQLTKQIEINPRSATTWEALGTLYKTAGRYDDAVQAFKQAIAIAPKTVSYYHNLGLVYAAQGNNEEAFKTFQEVLELDPNHSLTHASLGGYYKKMGLDELAKKHIGKAMKHIYESENEYNRACMDAICGNVDNAIKLLRVALENRQTYVDWVLNDPDLDSLRGDDRFRSLISDFSI